MHYCSVKLCGHNTKSSGLGKDGISFHRFPKCPKIKEKWIDATKRPDNWFPTQNSVICSVHFKTECFRVTEKDSKRFLYPHAVPTLHLPTVISCEESSAKCENTNVAASVVTPDLPTDGSKSTATDYGVPTVSIDDSSDSSHSTVVSPNIPPATDKLASTSNSSSHRKKHLRRIIADLSIRLKESKLKVKRLQNKNRVLNKKVTSLKSQLKELQDKQLITD